MVEVNYPLLQPEAALAIFAGLGLVICFLRKPFHPALAEHPVAAASDWVLAAASATVCGFVVVQSQPAFQSLWLNGASLGNRAGLETSLDTAIGLLGLLLVMEATRRSIGWALPLLAAAFLGYAWFGASLPDWLFPHRGYGLERVVAQTFLHSQGVFGVALRVMYVYVFLFVLFGAVLKVSGGTRFIIDFAQRALGRSPGGPAKVAVLSSGLMGSLSGSAVANTATTGTFTIPMMRSAGFKPHTAAGVEAAASSGGALVPPVMGAGAYMMLEIIDPPVTYLQIIRAALLPAILYYSSLLLIVHFQARRLGLQHEEKAPRTTGSRLEGMIFLVGFATLLLTLLAGYTVFRAATVALIAVVVVGALDARTRLAPRKLLGALTETARDAVPLITAAACVGVVIGVVTLTGIGSRLPSAILSLSQGNLLAALALIMISSIILGMGLPSAVCYLLMATLVGPALGDLGVVPLGAHLFIFYFGMMSMVTPPVALAAYAAGSIAGADIMKTGFAAFRFALVGFTLPYMFVLRPALLLMAPDGGVASPGPVIFAVGAAALGIVPLAAAIARYCFAPLHGFERALFFLAAALLLVPAGMVDVSGVPIPTTEVAGTAVLAVAGALNWRHRT